MIYIRYDTQTGRVTKRARGGEPSWFGSAQGEDRDVLVSGFTSRDRRVAFDEAEGTFTEGVDYDSDLVGVVKCLRYDPTEDELLPGAELVGPSVSINSPSELPNDGSSDATVEVTHNADVSVSVSLTVAESSSSTEIPPDGSHTETVTTTASAGTIIRITAESPQIQDAVAEIEVVQA